MTVRLVRDKKREAAFVKGSVQIRTTILAIWMQSYYRMFSEDPELWNLYCTAEPILLRCLKECDADSSNTISAAVLKRSHEETKLTEKIRMAFLDSLPDKDKSAAWMVCLQGIVGDISLVGPYRPSECFDDLRDIIEGIAFALLRKAEDDGTVERMGADLYERIMRKMPWLLYQETIND